MAKRFGSIRTAANKTRAVRFRNPRRDRTPYYMVDLPRNAANEIESYRERFIETFGRDYEDLDPQFWDFELTGTPRPVPGIEDFIRELADAMAASNHHRAHVHAVRKTQRVVYDGNFKDVPEAWTVEWNAATQEYEKWMGGDGQQPWGGVPLR